MTIDDFDNRDQIGVCERKRMGREREREKSMPCKITNKTPWSTELGPDS